MNTLGNYIQFLIFGAFIGFSVLAWVIRKLSEQSVKRRYLQERERQQVESLRTGRAPEKRPAPASSLSLSQRLAEIARSRQQEIARQRQASSPPVSVRTAGSPPTHRTPAQPVPAQRAPTQRPPATRPQTPRTAPAPGRTLSPAQRRAQVLDARRRELAARKPPAAPPPAQPLSDFVPVVQSAMTAFPEARPQRGPAQPKPVRLGPLVGLDQQSLRRAFILKELLDHPIALRDQQPFQ